MRGSHFNFLFLYPGLYFLLPAFEFKDGQTFLFFLSVNVQVPSSTIFLLYQYVILPERGHFGNILYY